MALSSFPQHNKGAHLESPLVSIAVGAEPTKLFRVHGALLCEHSAFFTNALTGPWKETGDGVIPMPEDEPETFGLFVRWLYTGKIFALDANLNADFKSLDYTALAKLYVLCDKLLSDNGKAAALDTMTERAKVLHSDNIIAVPTLQAIRIIYQRTMENDPARTFFVDLHTINENLIPLGDCNNDVPAEFSQDLLQSLLQNRPLQKELDRVIEESAEMAEHIIKLEKQMLKMHREIVQLRKVDNEEATS